MLLTKTAFRGALACAIFTGLFGTTSASAATLLAQSWNGWHWSRTGLLTIQVGDNVGSAWKPHLKGAAGGWSKSPNIDYAIVKGTSTSSCGAVFGTLQVCSGDYGKNGWLGYTNVWTLGTQIVQATIRLNDYYFNQSKYNNVAFRQYVACQELGNALGLQDSDRGYSNANSGSCMDYTNDASGTKGGANGTLANVAPSKSDLTNLAAIYAKLDTSQLAQTKLTVTGNAAAAVPEPAAWTTMAGGFCLLGATLRRSRRRLRVA